MGKFRPHKTWDFLFPVVKSHDSEIRDPTLKDDADDDDEL